MNILNLSTIEEYKYSDVYTDLDEIDALFTVTYDVEDGSGVYNFTIKDGDSSNPSTTVTTENAAFFDIRYSGLKSDFPNGKSYLPVTISVDIEDVADGTIEEKEITVELIFNNEGTLQTFGVLSVTGVNLNKATGYDRDSSIDTLKANGTLKLVLSGGSGEFDITWDAEDFNHEALSVLNPDQLSSTEVDVILSANTADIPENYLESAGGNWVQSGRINYTVYDRLSKVIVTGLIYWSYSIAIVSEIDPRVEYRYESRTVSSRFRIKDVDGISWYDMCYDEMYGYNVNEREWQRLIPSKVFVRDANNIDWLEVNCDFDPEFDDPCQDTSDEDCNGSSSDPFAGSGNGVGSNGPVFDVSSGYPAGYDMPDCFLGGFAVSTISISQSNSGQATGFVMQRPGLLQQETYDPTGVNPDDTAKGTWDSPNITGASTWSRGSAVTETIYELTDSDGFYELLYAAYDGVSIDVYHHGIRVATTCGQVPDKSRGVLTFGVKLGLVDNDKRILVRVRGPNFCEWAIQLVGAKDTNDHYDFDPHSSGDYAEIGQNLYEEPDFVKLEYLGTPIFPAPCRATVGNTNIDKSYPFRMSDRVASKNFFEYYHYASDTSGLMVLDYSSWNLSDKIEVYHKGVRIASNYDFKNDNGSITFEWHVDDTDIHELVVRVYTETLGKAEQLSSWYYTLYCVDTDPDGDNWSVPVGPREFPWDCDSGDDGTPTQNPTTRNIIFSQGHPVMEDHINIDNGVGKGVFRIQFNSSDVPLGESLITVFTKDDVVIKCYNPNTDTFENTIAALGQSVELDYFNFDQETEEVYKEIYVRVECQLGENWTYTVGCPVPLIDITLEPIEISADISIDDAQVVSSEGAGQVMARLSKPMSVEVFVDYDMSDGSAKDQIDYCISSGTIVFPVGVTEVPINFSLAPCDEVINNPDSPEDDFTFYYKPIVSVPTDLGTPYAGGMLMESSKTRGVFWNIGGVSDDNDDLAVHESNGTKAFLASLAYTKEEPAKVLLLSDTDVWYTFESSDNDGRTSGRAMNSYLDRIWPDSQRTVTSAQALADSGLDNKAYYDTFDFIIFRTQGFNVEESFTSIPTISFYEELYDSMLGGVNFLFLWTSTGLSKDDNSREFKGENELYRRIGLETSGYASPTLSVETHILEFGEFEVWDGLTGPTWRDNLSTYASPQSWWTTNNRDLVDIEGRQGKWLITTV